MFPQALELPEILKGNFESPCVIIVGLSSAIHKSPADEFHMKILKKKYKKKVLL